MVFPPLFVFISLNKHPPHIQPATYHSCVIWIITLLAHWKSINCIFCTKPIESNKYINEGDICVFKCAQGRGIASVDVVLSDFIIYMPENSYTYTIYNQAWRFLINHLLRCHIHAVASNKGFLFVWKCLYIV